MDRPIAPKKSRRGDTSDTPRPSPRSSKIWVPDFDDEYGGDSDAQSTASVGSIRSTLSVDSLNIGESKKRGRGRPPTTGEYVGKAEAFRKMKEAEEELLRMRTERELADEIHSTREL